MILRRGARDFWLRCDQLANKEKREEEGRRGSGGIMMPEGARAAGPQLRSGD